MKHILLTALLIAGGTFFTHAQTVNNIPVKNIDVEYVQIVGTSKLLSNKINVQIDFGQQAKWKDSVIKDSSGRAVEFNSMIDALNFMASNGFEFVNAHTLSVSNQNVYHYMLRKRR